MTHTSGTHPLIAATFEYATHIEAAVTQGQLDTPTAQAILAADTLATAQRCEDDTVSEQLVAMATQWAMLRRAQLLEDEAVRTTEIPDDPSAIDD